MAQELKRLNSFGNYDQFGGYYDADEADAVLAEKDAEIRQCANGSSTCRMTCSDCNKIEQSTTR